MPEEAVDDQFDDHMASFTHIMRIEPTADTFLIYNASQPPRAGSWLACIMYADSALSEVAWIGHLVVDGNIGVHVAAPIQP